LFREYLLCEVNITFRFYRIDVGLENMQLKFYKSFGCAEHSEVT
jgi:hypothetical protein